MGKFRDSEIFEKTCSDFSNVYSKQQLVANKFEQQANYPMAYLAYWAIVEDFAKSLAPLCRRADLENAIKQWSSYLLGETKTKPKAISIGRFELSKEKSKSIPSEGVLMNVLDKETTPSIFILLNTDGKYRKRRNKIAHSAENVSKEVYVEFKTILLASAKEIEEWLSSRMEN